MTLDRWNQNCRWLGIIIAVWGVLGLLAAIGIVVVLSIPWAEGDHFSLPSMGSPLMTFALIAAGGTVVCLAAGGGLLSKAKWARPLGIVASVICLPTIPIGTAVGIFGLWVLLSRPKTIPVAGSASPPALGNVR